MIKKLSMLNWHMAVFYCVLTLITLSAVETAHGLQMNQMPRQMQTTVTAPRDRSISLQLPLLQPEFTWTFLSKQDLLAGKLILYITRGDETATITIFENDTISEGWESLPRPTFPKAGEIYFGFQSTKKYLTAPGDRLKIELQVKKDLEGIGATETGILPAGTYISEGTYSGLIDEFPVSPDLRKDVSEETISEIRKMIEFKAFMENWESQWPLKITSQEGWLSPEQKKQYQELRSKIEDPIIRFLSTVEGLDGKKMHEEDMKGKAVLAYLWTSHDISCHKGFQMLDKMVQQYKGADIVFMAITEDSRESVNSFLYEHNYKTPVFLAEQGVLKKWFPSPIPVALLLGIREKGIFILDENPLGQGYPKMTEKELSDIIQNYLKSSSIHDVGQKK